MKMTADLEFLANIEKIYVNKDARRKYFSNVEDLWLLIVTAPDKVVERFMAVEDTIFSVIFFWTRLAFFEKNDECGGSRRQEGARVPPCLDPARHENDTSLILLGYCRK